MKSQLKSCLRGLSLIGAAIFLIPVMAQALPLPLLNTQTMSRTSAIPVLPTFPCVVKVDGAVKETYEAVNRTECYNKTSFGSANCTFYKNKGYFPVAGTTYFLEQYFNGTDLVNSQYCHWAG